MGCTQSKIENEEAVARCKDRKQYMKEAVSARNAFAAAHSSYATNVKNTGAALSDFAHGEVQNPQLASPGLPNVTLPTTQAFEIPLPPPPLPPMHNSSPAAPLQRAATMPEIKMIKPESTPVGPILEEDEENELENEGSLNGSLRRRSSRKGGGSSRIGTNQELEVEEEAARPPMPPPQSKLAETQIEREMHDLPMYQPQNTEWEYFFPSMENIAGTNLSVGEEPGSSADRDEEFERKAFDEKPNRRVADDDHEDMTIGKHEVPEHMTMTEKVMEQPVPPAAMAVAVGKGPKKVKQGPVPMEGKRIVKQNVNLLHIFTELDDHFLKASESAHEVSKMLEATRLHYHSNFADNRGNDTLVQ